MHIEDIFVTIETINVTVAKILAETILHVTRLDGKPDVVITIVGKDGRLLYSVKSGDNPLLISDSWAFKKALTALSFGASTMSLYEDKPALNVGDEYCKSPGGVLIPSSCWSGWLSNSFEQMPENGTVVPFSGAIGVSGRSSQEDHQLAIDGLKDFIKTIRKD
jgi:uncharacterized protein GlcG (DUF336 family)